MNKKPMVLWLGLFLGILTILVSGAVLAASLLSQHNTMNIVNLPPPPTTPALAVFSDAGATSALADPLAWGDIQKGATTTKTYYVKNTGTGAATVTIALPSVTWGTVTTNPLSGFSLAAGAVQSVDVTVNVSATATAGAAPFDVGFSY